MQHPGGPLAPPQSLRFWISLPSRNALQVLSCCMDPPSCSMSPSDTSASSTGFHAGCGQGGGGKRNSRRVFRWLAQGRPSGERRRAGRREGGWSGSSIAYGLGRSLVAISHVSPCSQFCNLMLKWSTRWYALHYTMPEPRPLEIHLLLAAPASPFLVALLRCSCPLLILAYVTWLLRVSGIRRVRGQLLGPSG